MGQILTAYVPRRPVRQGLRVAAYAERNVRPRVPVYPQESPDPIRYGDTPARPARVAIAVMSGVGAYGAGLSDVFIPQNKDIPRRFLGTPRGTQLPMGGRPNIATPSVAAYGSLFTINQPVYDVTEVP